MPTESLFLTGSAIGFVGDDFNVAPDKTPTTEPLPFFTTASPQLLHWPVHLPLLLQSTLPPAATQLYPPPPSKYTPPALSQLPLISLAECVPESSFVPAHALRECPAITMVARTASTIAMSSNFCRDVRLVVICAPEGISLSLI